MEILKKYKNLIFEFMRYIVVGGTAFIVDFAVMYGFQEFVFKGEHVFIAVFLGYTVGLIYNFLLSCGYVFKDGFKKIEGKELSSFIIFTVIGLIGLVLTEFLMFLFVNVLAMRYTFGKIISAGIVMFWNYIARKITIYK